MRSFAHPHVFLLIGVPPPSPLAFPTGCADEALSSLNGCELLLGVLLDVAVDEPAPATYAFCSHAPRAVRVVSPITPLWILRLLQRKVLRDAGMSQVTCDSIVSIALVSTSCLCSDMP